MKIAIVGPAYPYRGGIANFSERLAHEFMQQGDEVHLYTFKMMYPNFLFPGKTQYAETPIPFPLHVSRRINAINPLNWWRVAKTIRKENYDILLTAYSIPFLGPSLGTISRKAKAENTKTISIIHNLKPHEKRAGDDALSAYFLNSFDAHLALSKNVEEDILERDKKHPVLFYPHPLYDTFGKLLDKKEAMHLLNLSTEYKYILFFGLIRDYKGLDILLQAMGDQRLKDKKIKLIVAGEFYGGEEKYRQIIQDKKIEDRVLLYNHFIPDNEVNRYFSAADLVVQPYKHATQSGITQIAYHFSKPMIVTNVGGLPETVPHNKVGLVCEPNAESLANAILTFYTENKEKTFIANMEVEKSKYSWKGLVEKIKRVKNI